MKFTEEDGPPLPPLRSLHWLSCAFYWGVGSVWQLYHKGLIGGVLQQWLSFWKVLPSPQRNSVRVTNGFLVTSLTKALLPRSLSLAGRQAPGRVLVFPNFFHLRMMEVSVLGDLQGCRNVLVPFPRSVPRHNPVSDNYFDLMLGFCSDMHCQLWVRI